MVEACGKKILVDCGLQQGGDEKDEQRFPFSAASIDYVFVTHAHIDHSGRLPLLVKEGFKGKIFTTKATCELLSIMLRDSAHIQEMDALWKNRKGQRAGNKEIEPLYTVVDAENVMQYLVPCSYKEVVEVDEGIKIRFVDAGHLLGSASIEVEITENGVTKNIAFSGDIGNFNQPIIKDPHYLNSADVVIMESTYGDRNHEPPRDYTPDLAKIIDDTLSSGGNVVIPSFAVGRTQELLYFIREIKDKGLVKNCPGFPVYVDSPLANEATKIYSGDLTEYADAETTAIIKEGEQPISFEGLHMCETSDESKLLNFDPTPKVIISSSGMCEAGRIRHHLKHNLWRPECTVVFVGYQAVGTLGRILIEGAKNVKLFGEEIAVHASIINFKGLSAHGDMEGLLSWVEAFTAKKPDRVYIVHGEEDVAVSFTERLRGMGFDAVTPNYLSEYDLATNECLDTGRSPEEIAKTEGKAKERPMSDAFKALNSAAKTLLDVIRKNEGGTNKDLAEFAKQIAALSSKWDR